MHPFIKYSGPIVGMNGMIYYKEPTNIIASDVLGFDEVRGKIYYITTSGDVYKRQFQRFETMQRHCLMYVYGA